MSGNSSDTIASIAKKLNLSPQDIIAKLVRAGITNKKVSDSISIEEIKILSGASADVSSKTKITSERLTVRTATGIQKKIGIQIKRKHKIVSPKPPLPTPVQKPSVAPKEPPPIPSPQSAPSSPPTSVADASAPPAKENDTTPAPTPDVKKSAEKPAPPPKKKDSSRSDKSQAGGMRKQEGKSASKPLTPSVKKLSVSNEISDKRKKRRDARKGLVDTSAIQKQSFTKPLAKQIRVVQIGESITINELANFLALKQDDLVASISSFGVTIPETEEFDQATAALIVEELGHTADLLKPKSYQSTILKKWKNTVPPSPRGPVVSVMGHVDHGKTTLLDRIRNENQVSKEAGGITQHLGAYQVAKKNGTITFLDTPGHSAFSAMRSMGSSVTDIIILVVAGDDGVNQQTQEVIALSQEHRIPMVVAVTKSDKPDYNYEKVQQELMSAEVIPDSFGGDTQFVKLSAQSGDGVDALLDAILLQAELLELTATTTGSAKLTVIESRVDKSIGIAVTAIVQEGMLAVGDFLLCGDTYGKIKILRDTYGEKLNTAIPSQPIVLYGLRDVPQTGMPAYVLSHESECKQLAELYRLEQQVALEKAQDSDNEESDEDPFLALEKQSKKVYHLIIKTDVQGTRDAIDKIISEDEEFEDTVNIILNKTGPVLESDVKLAIATQATIIAFNVRAESKAKALAKKDSVSVSYYNVIYHIVDDLKKLILSEQPIEKREEVVGLAEVRQVFDSIKFGQVAGCIVKEGYVKRKLPIRVLRKNIVVFEGELESLRRFKNDVDEVKNGIECGIAVKRYNDVQVGDSIEVFDIVS